MERRGRFSLVLFGWALLQAGRDGVWQQVGDFGSSYTCDQVRDSTVAKDILREIGTVLADQPADNPIRQQAYERAARRVHDRYRCEWRGS